MSSQHQLCNLNSLGNSLQDCLDTKLQICDIHQFRSTITKPKPQRTQEQISRAVKFLKGLPLFASIQNDQLDINQLLLELIDSMECEVLKQGEIIFDYRDKASKFYIVLKGSVDIYMPKTEEERKLDILKLEKLIQKKIHSLQRHQINEGKDFEVGRTMPNEDIDCQKIKQLEQILANKIQNISKARIEILESLLKFEDYFQINIEELISKLKKTKTLGFGTYFGEIALTMDCLRSAKAVASSDLHVATLFKDDYKKIFHYIDSSFKDKVNFFIKLIGLTSNDAVSAARFCYGFQEKHYMLGQKIFKQGEISQEVFIIKQGEVQISTQDTLDEEYHFGHISPRILNKKRVLTKKLTSWGAYSFLGEKEALTMKPYDITATSNSNETVLYVISTQEFRLLQANYKDIFKKIFDKCETKTTYLKDRLENIADRSRTISPMDTSRTLTHQDIQNLHTPREIEEKHKKLALPKLQDRPVKKVINYCADQSLNEDPSPMSLFSNSTPRCRPVVKTSSRLLTKMKTESTCTSNVQTPKNASKDKSTFGDYFNTSTAELMPKQIQSQEFPSYTNSRLSRFVFKLKNRKLKEATQPSTGIIIRSQRKFEEDPCKSAKVNIKQQTSFLAKDALTSSSSECDSYIDNLQVIKKPSKPRCSIIHHLK